MVVLGVSILYKYDVVLDVIKDSHAEVVPIVFIAIGSAIFLIAFFGCCGAIFESECMILTVSTIKCLFNLCTANLHTADVCGSICRTICGYTQFCWPNFPYGHIRFFQCIIITHIHSHYFPALSNFAHSIQCSYSFC